MVSQWKLEKRSDSMEKIINLSEVQCDVCSEPKLKAVKSCLVCLSSFCESHLQPHLSAPRLKRHQLMEPVDDLEDRMCPTHDGRSSSTGSAARALSELETSLSQKFNNKKELRRVQTFAVDVTLDPDTAQPWLDLSEDLKQVHHTGVKKKLPDSPQRFDTGRFYFEVQVKGKTMWTLGVAQESVNRKGKITVSPKNGFWTIWLRDKDKYSANAGPPVLLSPLRPPQKVGVFVDYGAGLVSFYDVDSADLLYSFTGCCFREKLFPYFSPLCLKVER
uniref:B30.2/SPRY domain-containing protein n=1 Tax=Neogobius melanostomus TaxID=47308 RepID=A0A8C6SGI9_9GOBI